MTVIPQRPRRQVVAELHPMPGMMINVAKERGPDNEVLSVVVLIDTHDPFDRDAPEGPPVRVTINNVVIICHPNGTTSVV